MHAQITAHKGILVLDLLATASIDGQVATSLDRPGNLGQVIMDTERHLGVSAEALAILRTIKRSGDAIGDVDWFGTDDGKSAFSWLGGPHRLMDPSFAEGSRTYQVGKHQVIPNDVPAAAKEAIEAQAQH